MRKKEAMTKNEVTKRDGRIVDFHKEKIIDSVLKAFKEVDGEVSQYARNKAHEIAGYVEGVLEDHFQMSVEDIQDIIEDKLMASNRKDVARAYIIYRSTRSRVRDRNSAWMKAIREKLSATNVQNQNANVDEHSFGGRKGEADSELMRKIALDDLMSEMSRENHLNNEIYIHDLDAYVVGMHNCLSIPFDKLLANGFNTRQTDVRPAQSVNTAFQLVAVIFQLQSLQQFGGVSATHLDHTMVPYVRKSFWKHYRDGYKYLVDKSKTLWFQSNGEKLPIDSEEFKNIPEVYKYAWDMTVKEVYQAVEGMYHNLND